ncbi:MAG: PAS domain S-box protein [Mangrovibacterium sp.]|nr:PAS domain S-box protein [Mangrovibacterium sp.]
MITDLIRNATLLITLIVFYGIIGRKKMTHSLISQVVTGLLFGGIVIIGMNMPITYSPGVIYDGRTVVLSLAGLFSGGLTSVLAVLLAGAYRVYLGGAGMWAGLLSSLCAALIGMLFRHRCHNKPETIRVPALILMGFSVHLAMLLSQLLLPWPSGLTVVARIWMPVILIFPAASLITGVFLRNTLRKISAEAEIRKSEALYRTTLHSIGDAVITANFSGNITFMNPVAEQLTGWTEQEALGLPVESVVRMIHEDTGLPADHPLKTVLKEGKNVSPGNQSLLVSGKGKEIPVASSLAPIKDDDDTITGAVMIFRDQTEERRKQKQLHENRILFHTLTEQSPVGIFRTDPDGITTFVNPKWCQLSGLTPGKAIGTRWLDSVHPDDRERVAMKWEMRIGEHGQSFAQFRFLRPNGQQIWVLGEIVPEKAADDSILGYIGTITDISEQKKAEHELAQSRENFKQSMDESPLGMRIVTETGKTLYTNKALLDIYGYENIREFQDTPAENRYTKNCLQLHRLRKERRRKGEDVESEYNIELVRKDGSIRNVHIHRKMLNWDGKQRYLAIYQDFTDRKKAEDALEQAKNKAEESDRLKSAFLANMSHEIRTPLNTILGFSSILTAEEELSPEEKEAYSGIIDRSSDSLLQIINDILDISKLETGQLKILNSRFDAVPVLDELSRVFDKRLAELGKTAIQLRVSTHPAPVFLNLDRVRFYQIFSNLLNNSLKFTENGEVRFGIAKAAEGKASFFVSDTGIGIKKELQSAVFERFRQVNETSTRTHGGTGLGLSIVKNLVELMGGTITVESEPGQGTTFRFTLPADDRQPVPEQSSLN